jgi:hypothetical protein
MDATQALLEGRYRVEGDVMLVAKLSEWFPSRRLTAAHAASSTT